MKWTPEAQAAVGKVPFFIRPRVRKKVEEEATRQNAKVVTMSHVKACQQQYLNRMEEEVKGYQVETCFGPSGCPNRIGASVELVQSLEEELKSRNLKAFLKERVSGQLKFHHEFRVVLSDCPNACSRPHIADIGIIGASKPGSVKEHLCTRCGNCEEVCQESAIRMNTAVPIIDRQRCVTCGQCIQVCSPGALFDCKRGYRIMLGGKLGRHPRLATELPGIFTEQDVVLLVKRCLDHYQRYCLHGERFGEVLERTGTEELLVPEDNDYSAAGGAV
nr:4Fe-4S binding protein [Deltaproteobacteria bacterium]